MVHPSSANPHAKRRIGLLGGSFNPAHDGHREISLAALSRLELDVVWWLVTPGNPLKDPDSYAPFHVRAARARQIADHPDIVVSDFEQRQSLQYTAETLERIDHLHPEASLVWLMGADSLVTFHNWKDWQRLAAIAPIAVFNRPGYKEAALLSEAARTLAAFRIKEDEAATLAEKEPPAWVFINTTDNPLSSTSLRNG